MNTRTPVTEDNTTPTLVIDAAQLAQLRGAVRLAAQTAPEIAERLLEEIDRAEVLPSDEVPDQVVTIGRWVRYQNVDNDSTRTVQLVLPAQANAAEGKLSIVSPIGAALIGLSEGQLMPWETRDGDRQWLRVLQVSPTKPREA
jgi:regulator of nucleoside diphosphate kinase